MYGYVYKSTNLVNNKIYIGQHKSAAFDKHYYGSGIWFKEAFAKYGKENWICEMLEECETKELLDERETYWIRNYNATDPSIGYNLSAGGNGNSEHQRQVVSEYMKNRVITDETREKMRVSKLGNNNGHGNKGRISNRKGAHLSNETKEKISNKVSKSLEEFHNNLSPEQKVLRGKAISEGKKGKIAITDGLKTYFIDKKDWELYDHNKYYKMTVQAYKKQILK